MENRGPEPSARLSRAGWILTTLRRLPALRAHAGLSLAYLLSRYLLDRAGMRLNLILDWMFINDPADLRDRLLETLYYGHGFPPGMNLVTGVLMKISDSPVAAAHALFQLLGLVMVNSLLYLGRALGLSWAAALALAVAFALSPQVIWFEHLYIYEIPVVSLLCLAAACLHAAVQKPSFWRWAGCFLCCAAIGWIRSSFHLVWFGTVVGLGFWFAGTGHRRQVLLAAIGPAVLLLAVYVKNLVVFGVFGALTWGVGSLTTATIRNMDPQLRDKWVQRGKLSRYAALSVYSGPRDYLPFFPSSENPRWPPMMNVLERPSLGAPNFNHWFFLEINRRRREDALVYLKERPLEYAATVALNTVEFFSPSTRWHPYDDRPDSPHFKHRLVLGRWESLYDRIVHQVLLPPVGLYLFLPVAFGWALVRARIFYRTRSTAGAGRAALLAFSLLSIAYVTVSGVMVAFGEAPRYRFQIDPVIWLIAALAVSDLWRAIRRWAGDCRRRRLALSRQAGRFAGRCRVQLLGREGKP